MIDRPQRPAVRSDESYATPSHGESTMEALWGLVDRSDSTTTGAYRQGRLSPDSQPGTPFTGEQAREERYSR